MPYSNNPYVLPDLGVIIDAYTSYVPDAIREAPDRVSAAIRYAALSNRLSNLQDQAAGAIEALYSYGVANRDDPVVFDIPGVERILPRVQGIEMQNTMLAILNADNAGEAAAILLADCVPCSERIIALLSMNPLEDLWDAFEKIYQSCFSFILDLYDFLFGDKSVEVFADFCSLFQFLNFMCVPDLVRMATVLTKMIEKYSIKLRDIQYGLAELLGMFLGPTLAHLLSVFDKYTQLILDPLYCVLDSLDAQLQKSDVGQVQRIFTEGQPGERSIQIDTKSIAEGTSGALQSLRKYMVGAISEIQEEIDKAYKDALEYLGLQDEMDKSMFDVVNHIEALARHVGLIQATIIALLQGAIICGPGTTEEDLQGFLNNFVGPRFDLSFRVDGEQIHITPMPSKNMDRVLDTVGVLVKSAVGVAGDTSDTIKRDGKLAMGEATVTVKNCLRRIQDSELDKVKDFLSTFPTAE